MEESGLKFSDGDAAEDDFMDAMLMMWVSWGDEDEKSDKPRRQANEHRNRQHALNTIQKWSDAQFVMHFRLTREDFCEVRDALKEVVRPRKRAYAELSSGSQVSLETKLFVTLRILAGAKYQDLVWYGVPERHVWTYTFEIVHALNATPYLDNIKLPRTLDDIKAKQEEWAALSYAKFNDLRLPGTLGAGDGFLVAIKKPKEDDARNMQLGTQDFWYRKGFYGLLCRGICDAYGTVMYWAMKWPGSTNDIAAYKQLPLESVYFKEGGPAHEAGAHFVLDEAYSSIGGDHHLCPYSKAQLEAGKKVSMDRYNAMLTFNNCLSSQRMTIERCFGIILARWGILWQPMAHSVKDCTAIVTCVVRLHNLCMARWRKKRGLKAPLPRLPRTPTQEGEKAPDVVGEAEVKELLQKLLNCNPVNVKARRSAKRSTMTQSLQDNGLFFDRSLV